MQTDDEATRAEQLLRDSRHPSEAPAFVLAVTAVGVVLAIGLFAVFSPAVLGGLLAIVGVALFIWLNFQIGRVRMRAHAVAVTSASFPALQEVIDDVRSRLGYRRRVDVFVVRGQATAAATYTYFGVNAILLDGSAIADLDSERRRSEVRFLLATEFGHLLARFSWWVPARVAVTRLGLQQVLAPFVAPWLRATVYTGDRLAYLCTRDVDVSMNAIHRALVGKDAAADLRPSGLIEQAGSVRQSFILRVAEILPSTPHTTNRYLELLAFIAQVQPADFDRLRDAVSPKAAAVMTQLVPPPTQPVGLPPAAAEG
ncbi:hypothetical protein [Agromyces rhizosphaerae]|nr:hypothetical protein [Agromyces rhizosphaerae]